MSAFRRLNVGCFRSRLTLLAGRSYNWDQSSLTTQLICPTTRIGIRYLRNNIYRKDRNHVPIKPR
jgi:hypothetical protein